MSNDIFLKEQQLMEHDGKYTHRDKDKIRERRKREIIKDLQQQIERIREAAEKEGVWILPIEEKEEIQIRYRYPGDKKGGIDHFLAGLMYEPEETAEGEYAIRVSGEDYGLIEMFAFSGKALFTDQVFTEPDPLISFLLKYNRIAQIEYLMYRVNWYKVEYRSLRTIPNLPLKKILQEHDGRIRTQRDSVYEELIGKGMTNPRWVSEQKAFQIVKEYYPDAKFQYQPSWLYGQRLDIFIPSEKT